MGKTEFSHEAYEELRHEYERPDEEVFSESMITDMNPKGLTFREARDSAINPKSVPVIIAVDVTGSMGDIPKYLLRKKLGTIMETLKDNGVENATVCFIAIGDHIFDNAPLQVGQFESGAAELGKWLTGINIEQGGGSNDGESYALAWLFAGRHTSTDAFELRGKKGFLFTIGDEWVLPTYSAEFLRNYMGYSQPVDLTKEELLESAKLSFNVFHIHVDHEGRHVDKRWKDLMGQSLIVINDPEIVAETIATTIAIVNGADMEEVVKGFSDKAIAGVTTALATINESELVKGEGDGIAKTGVIEL